MAAPVSTLALSPSGDRLASKLSGRRSATPRAEETSWCAASRSSADGWRIISRFVAGNPRTVSDEDRRVSIGSVCTYRVYFLLKEILLREKTPPKSASKPESNDGTTVGVKRRDCLFAIGRTFGGRFDQDVCHWRKCFKRQAEREREKVLYAGHICNSRRARVIWWPSVLQLATIFAQVWPAAGSFKPKLSTVEYEESLYCESQR